MSRKVSIQDSKHGFTIKSSGRQQGKTTAAIDLALANARRGSVVEYWTHSSRDCTEAFIKAKIVALSDAAKPKIIPVNGQEAIHYKTGGSVVFRAAARQPILDREHVFFRVFDNVKGDGSIRVDWPRGFA